MARDLNMNYGRIGSLRVAKALHEFIEQEATRGRSISSEASWSGFAGLLLDYGHAIASCSRFTRSSSPASINIIVIAPATHLIWATTSGSG
jgi:hypothetical protein